jgi:hypothetical protein
MLYFSVPTCLILVGDFYVCWSYYTLVCIQRLYYWDYTMAHCDSRDLCDAVQKVTLGRCNCKPLESRHRCPIAQICL